MKAHGPKRARLCGYRRLCCADRRRRTGRPLAHAPIVVPPWAVTSRGRQCETSNDGWVDVFQPSARRRRANSRRQTSDLQSTRHHEAWKYGRDHSFAALAIVLLPYRGSDESRPERGRRSGPGEFRNYVSGERRVRDQVPVERPQFPAGKTRQPLVFPASPPRESRLDGWSTRTCSKRSPRGPRRLNVCPHPLRLVPAGGPASVNRK